MRVVVTGRAGQVACSLVEQGELAGHEIVLVGRPALDLASDREGIVAAIAATRPDVIVSAAAYTSVDKAETDREQAFAVNMSGAGAVAAAAQRLTVPLVHLSTDYVFDGAKPAPYVETDEASPTGVYGASKLAGERAVLAAHDHVAILRTAWVYSPFGTNFVKTMLRLAGEREEVGVVCDQYGNPTSALDLADGIIAVAANLVADRDPAHRGLFHMAGSGDANWSTFAQAIFAASSAAGGPSARVRPIASADFPTLARRPVNSRLSGEKLAAAHGVRLPDWHKSMDRTVSRLVQGGVSSKRIDR